MIRGVLEVTEKEKIRKNLTEKVYDIVDIASMYGETANADKIYISLVLFQILLTQKNKGILNIQ